MKLTPSPSLLRVCLAGLLAGAPLVGRAAIERTVEKSFTVQPGGSLRLDTDGGSVRIETGPEGAVRITARERIRASSESEADRLLTKLDLSFDQSGTGIAASASYDRGSMGLHFGAWPPVSVDFIVTAPASFSADARSSGGEIVIGNLNGRVGARTSGGGIKLGEARGGATLHSSGGSITVGRVLGAAEISTSGGDIRIDSVEGSVRARTSGGGVRATIAGALKGDCDLGTSGGSVRVDVGKAAAFRLDAATSGGEVDADGLTLTLEKPVRSRGHLAGSVNGGGPVLKLRSSGGDIVVRAD